MKNKIEAYTFKDRGKSDYEQYLKEEETLQSLAFHILEPCLSKSG